MYLPINSSKGSKEALWSLAACSAEILSNCLILLQNKTKHQPWETQNFIDQRNENVQTQRVWV